MQTWILRYDKRGICESPQTRAALLKRLGDGGYTDVIVMSHGWNNDFDDAVALYAKFLRNHEATVTARPPQRDHKPIFIGIVWPSTWLVFGKGPAIGGVGALPPEDKDSTPVLVAEMAGRIRRPDQVERFYELMEKSELAAEEIDEFARVIEPAFAGFDDQLENGKPALTDKDIAKALRGLNAAERSAGAAPDLDDWGAAGAAAAPAAANIFDKLDPRKAVRLFSVWQMKDRAGTVGVNGMAPLLADIARVAKSKGAKVHVAGHSYGCKVVLSGICGPAQAGDQFDSLLLLEPAISHLCFAPTLPGVNRPGGYRDALQRVAAPIFSTYSKKDFPLHSTFHFALRRDGDLGDIQIGAAPVTDAGDPPNKFAALGGYGPRDAGETLVHMPPAGKPYPSLAGLKVLGLDGSRDLINDHGDVKNEATAWALYQLVFR